MSCRFPLALAYEGTKANGKKKTRILGTWDDRCEEEFLESGKYYSIVKVPCGQCIGCRLDRSRQWADRMILELGYHDESYFVTLTYDDEHVPESYATDDDGCVIDESHCYTLVKSDFQKFMKRLRFNHEEKIRFFACGEYGSHTFRPHYHAIIFGLHLDDLVPFGRNELGQQYYTSEDLQEVWNKGFVSVAEVNWETCAYVARYVTKKLTGKAFGVYQNLGIEPEFSLMSRRPGIAWQYFEDHKDLIYNYDTINVCMEKSGRSIRPPRYYDKLFDVYSPEQLQVLKEKRQEMAADKARMVDLESDLGFVDRNIILDRVDKARLNTLKRSLD